MFVCKTIEIKRITSYLFWKLSVCFHKLYLKSKPNHKPKEKISFTNDFWGNIHVKTPNKIYHVNEFIVSDYFLNMEQSEKDFLIVQITSNYKIQNEYSITQSELDFCYNVYKNNILEEKDVHILDLIMMHDIIRSLKKEYYEEIMLKVSKLQSMKKIPNLKVYTYQ